MEILKKTDHPCDGAEIPGGVDVMRWQCSPPGEIGVSGHEADYWTSSVDVCCDAKWPNADDELKKK